ncbi:hypothetical protein [Mucilaginibacter koreensis]
MALAFSATTTGRLLTAHLKEKDAATSFLFGSFSFAEKEKEHPLTFITGNPGLTKKHQTLNTNKTPIKHKSGSTKCTAAL